MWVPPTQNIVVGIYCFQDYAVALLDRCKHSQYDFERASGMLGVVILIWYLFFKRKQGKVLNIKSRVNISLITSYILSYQQYRNSTILFYTINLHEL